MDFVVLISIIFVLAVLFLINHICVQFVKEKSIYLKEFYKLNGQIKAKFNIFQMKQNYHKSCNSKQQFDNFSQQNYIMALVDENLDKYVDILDKIKHNQQMFTGYLHQIHNLSKINYDYKELTKKSIISVSLFKKIELNQIEKDKLKPPMELYIEVFVSYISPQGRNRYSQKYSYTEKNIKYYIDECLKSREYKQSAKYQRSLMTDKLRYQVLTRDKHRCTICGATQQDGVKLHVDHICPVSKGGKTELSNLRTLCDRCNLGKGASYNPNGYN